MRSHIFGRRSWVWVSVAGLLASLVYAGLTTVAVLLYPDWTSPADTHLSRLGNADLSPDGWLAYNLGMVLCGILGIPFFVGVARCYADVGGRRIAQALLVLGVVNAVSVILTGVVAEHIDMTAHMAFSSVLFASMVSVLVVCGLMMCRSPGLSRLVALYGFVASATALSLLIAVLAVGGIGSRPGPALEWASVFVYLSWVVLVSADVARRRGIGR